MDFEEEIVGPLELAEGLRRRWSKMMVFVNFSPLGSVEPFVNFDPLRPVELFAS